MLFTNGRIGAVGAEADVMKHAGPDTVKTDLGGRALVPGFIDGHSHLCAVVDVQVEALCASPPAGLLFETAFLPIFVKLPRPRPDE